MTRWRILVVGAGIVGCNVALAASVRGHDVTLVDRHAVPRGPSSLNLGAIRLSGRAMGRELQMAVYGRGRWQTLGSRIPEIGFRPAGSATLLRDQREISMAERYVNQFSELLRLEIVPGREIPQHEPAVTGEFAAAMICRDDAWIRPGKAVPALVEYLRDAEAADVRLGAGLVDVDERVDAVEAITTAGRITTNHLFVCPGADIPAPFQSLLANQPVRRVRHHALDLGHRPNAPRMLVTDSSAFSIYPGFDTIGGAPVAEPAEWIVARSTTGGMLAGIHRSEPAGLPDLIDPDVERWLLARTGEAFSGPTPAARRRWSADVLEYDGGPYLRFEPSPRITIVTGLGTRGNTLAPAIAHEVTEART